MIVTSQWDIDRRRGERGEWGQQHAEAILAGLDTGTTEVKTDDRCRDRLFIEYECTYPRTGARPTGILTTEADTHMFVLGEHLAICVSTLVLKQAVGKVIARTWPNDGPHHIRCVRSSHPTLAIGVDLNGLIEDILSGRLPKGRRS